MSNLRGIGLSVAGLVLLSLPGGCGTSVTPSAPLTTAPATPAANPFANVVFLGDSLTAGFQNGSLLDTQQVHGFANLVATQAGFPIALPLIAAPGSPAVLTLVSVGVLPTLGQAPGTTSGRDNPTVQPTDLAVPGYAVSNVIHSVPIAGANDFTDLVLGYPAGNTNTQLQEAIALQPSTIFLWIGNNDALVADAQGTPNAMTPLADFTSDFTKLITSLKTNTSAHLVVANLPDVTAIPYMTPAQLVVNMISSASGLSVAQVAQQLNLGTGDLLNVNGVADAEAELGSLAKGRSLTALPDNDVLSSAEILTVQGVLNSYNQVIAQQVAAAGATLVDMHAFYATIAGGISINGYTATTAYLGGLFSLDGVHPSNTGYALVANQFIDAINRAFTLSVAAVDVSKVAASDPYFGLTTKPLGAVAGVPPQAAARAALLRSGRVAPQ